MTTSKKISELTAATVVNDADLIPIVQSGVNKKSVVSLLRDPSGALVYKSLWSQTGETEPSETVLVDQIGGPLVWTRNGTGDYLATLTGAFANKVIDFESQFYAYSDGAAKLVSLRLGTVTDNTIQIASVDVSPGPVDAGFSDLPFTLILYPV